MEEEPAPKKSEPKKEEPKVVDEAEELKNLGNKAYKNKKFDEAL